MILTFKTSINCASCIRSVSGFLNEIEGIKWDVDTSVAEKILTVEGDNLDKSVIINAVEEAGFDIEALV